MYLFVLFIIYLFLDFRAMYLTVGVTINVLRRDLPQSVRYVLWIYSR
jgi:hypothetical protein